MTNPDATSQEQAKKPIPVVVVADKTEEKNPLRLYALLIFFGTLLGSLIGAVADLGEATNTIERFSQIFNPPPTLCIVGSDTILAADLQLAADWQREFEAKYRVKLDIQAIGSGNGVRRAVEGGCAHILAMSEALTPQQYEDLVGAQVQLQCAAPVGYDIIAFVTDINNTLPTLEYRTLGQILNGRATNWGDVRGESQPITIWARPGSGTTAHILTRFAAPYDGDSEADFPPNTNYAMCESNEDCLNQTLAEPGSLYWVSTAWMRTKPPRYLRVLPILSGDERPVNPLTDDFTLDEYPSRLVRPLYLYVVINPSTSPEQAELARQFLEFVRSLRGQEILESHSYITYFDNVPDVQVELPRGFAPASAEGRAPICLGA